MKKLLPLLFYLTYIQFSFSQNYGNEWINYDQQYLKFNISSNGVYRIDYASLDAALSLVGATIEEIDPRNYQIFNLGEEQYIYVAGEEDGVFDPSDFIELYAKRNDGTFDANLFGDPSMQLHSYTSIISDTAAYFLTWNDLIDNLRSENLVNDLTGAPAAEPYNIFQTQIYYGDPYGSGYYNPGKSNFDLYSSQYTDGEGYATYKTFNSTLNLAVNTPNIYTGTSFTPFIKTAIIGVNESEHHVVVDINGVNRTDTTFFGYHVMRRTYQVDNLVEANTFTIVTGPSTTDYQRYSFVDATYPHLFDFDNASKIHFGLPVVATASTYIELNDFDEKLTSTILYDLTYHKRMVAIVEGDISKFHLPYAASESKFFCTSQDATDIKSVTAFVPVNFVNYNDVANQGTYLIISHPVLFDDGAGINWVDEYKNYRSSIPGGNFETRVVDINQLYDQFAYGIYKHPLAIRNFSMFAVDSFETKPEYVFLVGKSYTYDVMRANGTPEYFDCLVPTYGHPGSDNLLVARPGSLVPEIAVGRISAYNGNDVRKYYEKVVDFEIQQASTLQTIENKAWMKNVLHFAGGLDEYEQSLFNNFLLQYKYYITDTLYGANVTQLNKISGDPIYYSESAYIDSLINNGVSLVTFFGHSSTGSFDYDIGDPEDFENTGKYFMVFGNGCNIAAIHGYFVTLSERFIFEEDKAAIAFLAASSFSVAASLHSYALHFYQEVSYNNYHNSIGNIVKAASDSIWPTLNVFDQMTLEHSTLQGDPALRLNNHPEPDYVIEPPYIYFEPDLLTAGVDTFTMNIVVTNIGMAIDTSYFVEVKREKPDGTTETFLDRFDAPAFRDTIQVPFATDAIGGVGLNSFNIHIDNLNEIDEIDELNNILGTSVFIISDDAIPIYPVEFSIMNHIPEYFAASTANVLAATKDYIIEVDTTMNFNSVLHQSTMVTESGGVVYWQDPPVPWINNTVYYWRIAPDTTGGEEINWRSSSFLYLPGEITGWNQSHYFQYLEDEYNNIELEPSRRFEFVPEVSTYEVATGIYPTTNWTEVTSYVNGELITIGSCVNAGFVIIVVDPYSGDPWTTAEVGETNYGPYGDYYCSSDEYERMLQFYTSSPERREVLYDFLLNVVPDSAYLICYTNNYAEFNEWYDDTTTYGHSLFEAFEYLGATDIYDLDTFDYDRSYIFYAQKGNPASKYELISDEFGNKIEATFVIEGNFYKGDIETPVIGPAYAWDKAQWNLFSYDAVEVDTNSIDLIGVDMNGIETVIQTGLTSGDTTIAFIDATQYPYLKLRLNTYDDTLRTPAQFNYWRVIYDPVPEAALNPNIYFTYNNDTINQGETVNLSIAITNVSDYDMDSLLVSFYVIDQNQVSWPIPFDRQDSLLSDSSMIVSVSFESGMIPGGENTFIVEVNPMNDQPEQYHFNNLAYLQLLNSPDNSDPLLDVTFDGVHIFNGDIVSAKPEILISLKDENEFLAMADTSLLNITIIYPDGSPHDFYFDGVVTKFYPADVTKLAEDNTAMVEMNPVFEMDGTYTLQVHGEDRSGNHAGDIDYRTTFEVINKAMISNVFNYPNPFSTSTRFVFTLTGSEVPDYFKIQIMTVSGRVVREIMRNELGEMHVGNNITEFTWDGTDQYGDRLANGLYLYRVVTKLKGQSLEHYDTNTDQYFYSGFGKMYIAR